MIFKHKAIVINKENPFENCKLEREQYANVLTELLSNNNDGFVLAINNEWGTGKTTFVKMWKQQLENKAFKTLYFNAWENDFEENGLVALISELKSLTESKTNKLFKNVVKKAVPLAMNIGRLAASSIIDKALGNGFSDNAVKLISKATFDGLEKELENYNQRKENIEAFKESLSSFVEDTTNDKPVIFIIDELDRCKPSYSVQLLENIKHLFSIPKIVFVLSIDKIQLGNAVRGSYGSDKIDAEEYLRRFIDVEYSIPEPNTQTFCFYLFDYYDFKKYFGHRRNGQGDSDSFINFSSNLFHNKKLSLRLQEKIFAHARIAISSFENTSFIPSVFIFLIYLKITNEIFYKSICNLELDYQELINSIEEITTENYSSNNSTLFLSMEAKLLILYHNAYSKRNYNSEITLFDYDTERKKTFKYKSKIVVKRFDLEKMLLRFEGTDEYIDITINQITSKIDLLERLNY